MTPAHATRLGWDVTNCGDCPRRMTPARGTTCYVSLARGYPQMGKPLKAGGYPFVNSEDVGKQLAGSGSGAGGPKRSVAIIDHSVKARWDRNIGPRKRRLPMATIGAPCREKKETNQ
jgi:hypothetical protein